jgi:hypothetical protein
MEEIDEVLDQMGYELTHAIEEFLKFKSGNASAGTRLRKNMQNLKNQAQAVRLAVQDQKNEK